MPHTPRGALPTPRLSRHAELFVRVASEFWLRQASAQQPFYLNDMPHMMMLAQLVLCFVAKH